MRLRFSIRAVLCFTAVVACVLSWELRRIRGVRQAVQRIESLDGIVAFDDQPSLCSACFPARPNPSRWQRLKREHWHRVVAVGLNGRMIEDDDLASLAALGNLQQLHLAYTEIGDAGLGRLARLDCIEQLDLRGTQISDAGMYHLAQLAGLKNVDLRETRVSTTAIAGLRRQRPEVQVRR